MINYSWVEDLSLSSQTIGILCIARVNLKKGKLIGVRTNFTKITNPNLLGFMFKREWQAPEVRQNTKR